MVGGGLDYSAPFQRAIELIGKRWTGAVVKALLPGPARFNQLLAGIPGISAITFSGGVSEFVYARAQRTFGDLGPFVADELRRRQSELGAPVLETPGGIRAIRTWPTRRSAAT